MTFAQMSLLHFIAFKFVLKLMQENPTVMDLICLSTGEEVSLNAAVTFEVNLYPDPPQQKLVSLS